MNGRELSQVRAHSIFHRLPFSCQLIHNFRVNADIPSTAKPFGGWEQPNNGQALHRDSELRGHFTGHFLSASAQLWRQDVTDQ